MNAYITHQPWDFFVFLLIVILLLILVLICFYYSQIPNIFNVGYTSINRSWKLWVSACQNKKILDNKENLTIYKHRDDFLFTNLKTF